MLDRNLVAPFIAFLLAGFPLAASAAEIHVLSSSASALAQRDLAADFTRETGHTVKFTSGPPGVVQKHFEAGGDFAVVVMPTARIDAFDKAGLLQAGSRRALARVGIGIAVHESAPKLDLSTLDSTRKALLDARSISYSFSDTGGESGANSMTVLAKLGIFEAVKAKLVPVQNDKGQAMIAAREVEIGLYNLIEIGRAKGVVRGGAIPASVQVYSSFDIGIPATNAVPGPALAYRDFILDLKRRARWEAAGLELAPY